MASTSHFKVHAIALAALSALAGCASTTNPADTGTPRSALPALKASSSAQQRADLAIDRWWLVFDDANLSALIDAH